MKLLSIFSKSSFLCIEKALAKYIGSTNFKSVVERSPDRRFLLQVAAEQLGISERELIAKLAERTSLKLAPRVVTTELENIPNGITALDMRRAAYIAIVREGIFHGIICLNPARIPEYFQRQPDLQYLIAPWSEIATAISASEEKYEELKAQEREVRRSNSLSALARVLEFLTKEVEQYDRHEVKISLEGETINYLFNAPDGRTGRGEVNSNLIEVMREFLDQASTSPSERAERVFEAEMYERGRYYLLKWQNTNSPSTQLASSVKQLCAVESQSASSISSQIASTGYTVSVLLIDDSEAFGAVVERFFIREGIVVERKTSAEEAIKDISSGKIRPRVIVCDVHMPGMNGIQFVKTLRADAKYDDISVVMLTSDDQTETELEVIRLGGEAYVRKSEDPRLLCAHVERLLKKRGSELKAA